jgi:hypothetical protein
MKPIRLLIALTPIFLICSCASSSNVIATKQTTLYKKTTVAEYPVIIGNKDR